MGDKHALLNSTAIPVPLGKLDPAIRHSFYATLDEPFEFHWNSEDNFFFVRSGQWYYEFPIDRQRSEYLLRALSYKKVK